MSLAPAPPPDNQRKAALLYKEGEERLGFGDLPGARDTLQRALALDSGPARTHYVLGNCLRRLGLTDEAEAAYSAALERDPNLQEALFGLCFLHQDNGQGERAAERLRQMRRQFAARPEVLHQIGGLMGDFGLYADGADLYEEIVRTEPLARNYLRLGQYRHKLGHYAQAAAAFQRVLALNPDSGPAYMLLAHTRRFTGGADDTTLLRAFSAALQEPALSPTARICLHFALGKMHDDRGEHDEAFQHFAQGNRLRRAEIAFDATQWLDFVSQLRKMPSHPVQPQTRAAAGPIPLFVVGMLRSGTTLVEGILDAHPQVHVLGEVYWLGQLIEHARDLTGAGYPDFLERLDVAQWRKLRDEYQRHWPVSGRAAKYIVDKNPLNFMYLGFIERLFPEAQIVHCRRDMRDTCLSVYFQHFAAPHNNYAYDLEELGHFYNGYAALMEHWRQSLPGSMLHEIGYEDLVANQEAETRKLLQSLELPWDPACLAFHERQGSITTASLWQARQPLYATSVGRWRHYQRHLEPLLKVLGRT